MVVEVDLEPVAVLELEQRGNIGDSGGVGLVVVIFARRAVVSSEAVVAPIDVHQRLLYDPTIVASKDPVMAARSAPAVDFVRKALEHPRIVVGAFGHGVELLTPLTHLIKDVSITASPGSLVALCNAGARWVPPENPEDWATHVIKQVSTKYHANLNLITGTSVLSGGLKAFVDEMTRFIVQIRR